MISVVIPAFNEEKNIGKCLESLARQKTTEKMEVIVVDNNSTDATSSVANKYKDRLDLHVIMEKRKGRGAARRAGFAAAKGDIIFSTDADTIVPPDWIDSFVTNMQSAKGIVAATGFPKVEDCTPFQNKMLNFFIPHLLKLNAKWLRNPGLSGFSFAIKKDAYLAAGGFNADSDAYEDLELAFSIKRNKIGDIIFISDTPVIFSGRRFRNGMLKGWFQYIYTFTEKFVLKKKRVMLKVAEEKKVKTKKTHTPEQRRRIVKKILLSPVPKSFRSKQELKNLFEKFK